MVMSKEAFREWIAEFMAQQVLHIGNTPAESPKEGIPLDTVVITIDVRSVPREQIPSHAYFTGEKREGDDKRTVIVGKTVVDGASKDARLGIPERADAYEIIVIMPTDES